MTNHFPEHPHAFIKDGRVKNVAIFASHDEQLIASVAELEGATEVVSCCEHGSIPSVYWSWDGSVFTEPDDEYLVFIGVLELLPSEVTDEPSA